MTDLMRVVIEGGKYEYVLTEERPAHVLRYGEEWRDACGDKLIYLLFAEVADLRERLGLDPKTGEAP